MSATETPLVSQPAQGADAPIPDTAILPSPVAIPPLSTEKSIFGDSGNGQSIMEDQPVFEQSVKESRERRIIAEDPEWNLAPVEKLTALCIKVIVKNFEQMPIIDGIPAKYRVSVLSGISTDLPLSITAPLIPDEEYWKKCAIEKFINCDPSRHRGSWKQLFFEKYVQYMIEAYVPNVRISDTPTSLKSIDIKPLVVRSLGSTSNQKNATTAPSIYDTSAVVQILKLASPFVRALHIDQLRPAEQPEGVLRKATDPPPNHVDSTIILGNLTNLDTISLYYGVRDCGINFNWTMFGMTIPDCETLRSSLKSKAVSRTLKSLKIQSSGIDNDRARLIASALLDNETLTYLGDGGARGLAKVLASSKTVLTHLILANNKLNVVGVHAIGHALAASDPVKSNAAERKKYGDNNTLQVLNLRLNRLGDEGGAELCNLLLRNNSLRVLDLSANDLGKETTKALCALIRKNGKQLRSIDISCNKLGNAVNTSQSLENTEKGASSRIGSASSNGDAKIVEQDATGKALFEAVSHNKYISTLDIRVTDIPAEYIGAIQGIIVE